MSKKHILIITHSDYPIYEGLGVRIENLCKVYVKNGHKITVIAPNIEARRLNEEILYGYRIIRVSIPVLKIFLRFRNIIRLYLMILQTILVFFAYFKYLRKESIDVIQPEQVYSIPPAIIIKFFTGARIFVDDVTTVSDMLMAEGHTIIARVFTLMERVLFRMCDEFIYTSEVSRNYCTERGGNATIFLPNGVDCGRFNPEGKGEKIIFFNCSTYSYQNIQAIKNFLLLGRLLKNQVEIPFIFHLISSPLQNIPSGLIDEIRRGREWLFFEEGVPDIVTSIRKADVTLLPYSSGHHITGGARLKALEYMACGKLVISTPEGVEGIKGLISGKHAIITKTPEDMVPILVNVLNGHKEFDSMAEEGRLFVEENYDWDKISRSMLLRLQKV